MQVTKINVNLPLLSKVSLLVLGKHSYDIQFADVGVGGKLFRRGRRARLFSDFDFFVYHQNQKSQVIILVEQIVVLLVVDYPDHHQLHPKLTGTSLTFCLVVVIFCTLLLLKNCQKIGMTWQSRVVISKLTLVVKPKKTSNKI